jgi:membrane protein implicated in regulation of membrane protease activity
MLHDILAYGVALLCLAAIIAPSVPTGIVLTAGLAAIGAGALLSADNGADPFLVAEIVLTGQAVVLLGLVERWRRRRPRPMRRREDWAGWCTRPPALSEDEQRQVVGGRLP